MSYYREHRPMGADAGSASATSTYLDPATLVAGKVVPELGCQVMPFTQLSYQAGGNPTNLQCLLLAYGIAAGEASSKACPTLTEKYKKALNDVEGCFSYDFPGSALDARAAGKQLLSFPVLNNKYLAAEVNVPAFNLWQAEVNKLNQQCGAASGTGGGGGGGGGVPPKPSGGPSGTLLALALVGLAVWGFLRKGPMR